MPSAFDWLACYVRVTATSVSSKLGRVLLSLQGLGDGPDDPTAEVSAQPEGMWSALGIIARALDPTAEGSHQVVALRKENGFTPIAHHDPRITKARGNVNKGAVSVAGYGGGFAGFDYQTSSSTDNFTIYLPDGADPVKAHVLTMTKDQVLVLGKRGQYVRFADDGSIALVSPNGQNFITVSDDGVAISGPLKMVTGMLNGDVAGAPEPLMKSVKLLQWITQANVVFGLLAAAAGSPIPPFTAPSVVPEPATKASST